MQQGIPPLQIEPPRNAAENTDIGGALVPFENPAILEENANGEQNTGGPEPILPDPLNLALVALPEDTLFLDTPRENVQTYPQDFEENRSCAPTAQFGLGGV